MKTKLIKILDLVIRFLKMCFTTNFQDKINKAFAFDKQRHAVGDGILSITGFLFLTLLTSIFANMIGWLPDSVWLNYGIVATIVFLITSIYKEVFVDKIQDKGEASWGDVLANFVGSYVFPLPFVLFIYLAWYQ